MCTLQKTLHFSLVDLFIHNLFASLFLGQDFDAIFAFVNLNLAKRQNVRVIFSLD